MQSLPDPVTHPQRVRVFWGCGPQIYDSDSKRIVSKWLRQTMLKGVAYNQVFYRVSSDNGLNWSAPKQLIYEPGDGAGLQLSNFSLLENRETKEIEIYLTRYGENPTDFWGADAYRYTLRFVAPVKQTREQRVRFPHISDSANRTGKPCPQE